MAFLAVVRHFLFAFDHPAFTAEVSTTVNAVINRRNIISVGVAVATNTAVPCIAVCALKQSIVLVLDTCNTPDFPCTAIAQTFSFGDALQAGILPTISTFFDSIALHTAELFVTAKALFKPTAMQTETLVADAT